jgi:iron complex outermembrane recepter protein
MSTWIQAAVRVVLVAGFSVGVGAQEAEKVTQLEEVIVTAQKRAESVQKAPVAITALDTAALERSGVKDVAGLTAIVPNVAVRPFNNSVIVATRGISNENTSNLGDASLAFHVNGIYLGRPRAAAALFYDVERVELLRGPQGTLYGRNSTAGALNLITRRPDPSDFAGGVDLTLGDFDEVAARGYLNMPLSDSMALRAAVYSSQRDGYGINNRPVPPLVGPPPVVDPINSANANISSLPNGDDDDERAARLSWLFQPSEKARWLVVAAYQKTDEVGQVRAPINTPGYVATAGPTAGSLFLPQQENPNDPRIFSLNVEPLNFIESWDLTSEFGYALTEGLDITVLLGYRDEKSAIRVDAAGSANLSTVNSSGEAEQVSAEVRLASAGEGRLRWLTGLYYFDEDQWDDLFINNVGGGPVNVVAANPSISSTSYALFGEATFSMTDRARIIAGARYSRDERSRFGFTVAAPGVTAAPNPLPPGSSYANDQSWDRTNWKLGFDFDVAEDAILYATVSTGYRAGGFNASSALAYDPEELSAFELGFKSEWLDRRVRFNVAGFYYDYRDLQVTSPRDIGGRIQAFTQNAAEAKIWGLEIEAAAKLTSSLSIDFAGGYLNTEFGEFFSIDNICTAAGLTVPPQFLPGCVTRQRFNPDGSPVLAPVSPAPGAPLGPVFDLQLVNYEGNQLANAPEVTLNLGLNWTVFDGGAGSLQLRGAVRYVGEAYLSEYNRAPDQVDSYTQSDARLTYRSADKAFTAEAFVQNIEDNDTPASVSVTASGFGVSYLPPRTYGIRLGYSF